MITGSFNLTSLFEYTQMWLAHPLVVSQVNPYLSTINNLNDSMFFSLPRAQISTLLSFLLFTKTFKQMKGITILSFPLPPPPILSSHPLNNKKWHCYGRLTFFICHCTLTTLPNPFSITIIHKLKEKTTITCQ
jgi:hypothetical protein